MNNLILSVVLSFFVLLSGVESSAQKSITASWPFGSGSANVTSATLSESDVLSYATFTLGSNLAFNSPVSLAGTSFSRIIPSETISSGDAQAVGANAIVFSLKPKKGISFTPTAISFKASKIGTSGGTLYVGATVGSNASMLASGVNPVRNNTADVYSQLEYSVDLDASSDEVNFSVYITNLANTKDIAISDVVISGTYEGEAVSVASFTLSSSVADENAGTVVVNPSADSYDEGTSISVSATENFGYHFKEWTDASGNAVSSSNPYSFEISANTTLIATYTHNNVYPLNVSVEGGAADYMVQYNPVGFVDAGVHYYEDGTEVSLSAVNNAILSFTNWEDNSTNATRNIVMNGTKNVTANYSCEDYIVAWDFYNDNPSSERAADFASESENAGKFSLRTLDGTTSTWLALGVNKGGQNGKYGARVWRTLASKYYFESSFSTLGYSSISMFATVGDDFNAYSTVYAQYSVDGAEFVTFGTFSLPSRSWTSSTFSLPAEAENKSKVWVRFYPDYDSPLVGSSSDYDGFAVSDLVFFGTGSANSDSDAPILVSSIPSADATDVSASGSIILTFNEKVSAGEAKATLNGEELDVTISAKTAIFKYSGLNYGTSYTFSLPSDAILDRSGNAYAGTSISFTTMERTQPTARLFDAVVAADGSGDYLTITEAIESAPSGRIKPWLVFIKAGTYTGHHYLPSSKPYVHFIGQGKDKVFISDSRKSGGDNAYNIDDGATFTTKADNTYFEGVSFVNSYGLESNNGPQALAINTCGDRVIINRCGMYSYQDTYYTGSSYNARVYVKDTWIEGAVDFIYGQGNVFFDNDTINIVRSSGGYIVAPNHIDGTEWGYVFLNNVITAVGDHATATPAETSVWLGRPWHNNPLTVFINTKSYVTIPAAGWYETMGGLPKIWADYNTTDGNGNLLDLSNRRDTYYVTTDGVKTYGTAKNYLTDEEAAQYTLKNVLYGSDTWQPDIITEQCAKPQLSVSNGVLSWNPVPFAICYVVERNGVVVDIVTGTSVDYDSNSSYSVYAANEYGSLSNPAKIYSATLPSNAISSVSDLPVIKAYYTLDGKRVSMPVHGINIVEYVTGNGKSLFKKILK